MKVFFALSIVLMATIAHAAPTAPAPACVPEPLRIATLLMAATDELNEIKKQYVNEAMSISCEHIDAGVVEYTFQFRTCGMCLPTTALLKVKQDVTPTYSDGAPIYVKSVSIAH